jgi:hypothetical protein
MENYFAKLNAMLQLRRYGLEAERTAPVPL